MSREAKPYSLDDLVHAVSEYQHAAGKQKEAQNQLSAKRAAIKSFEEAEAAAAAEVARHEAKVRLISQSLK